MNALADKIAQLPTGWSMWQAYDGAVCIQIIKPQGTLSEVQQRIAALSSMKDLRETLSAKTAEEAIDKALAYTFPVSVSRRPIEFIAAEWKPVKVGNRWSAKNEVTHCDLGCHLATRTAIVEALDRFAKQSKERMAAWDVSFAGLFPNGAVEGRDYVYS